VDKYQFNDKFDVQARGTGKDNAKKKRHRKFDGKDGGRLFDPSPPQSKSKSPPAQDTRFHRPGRLQNELTTASMLGKMDKLGRDMTMSDEFKPDFATVEPKPQTDIFLSL